MGCWWRERDRRGVGVDVMWVVECNKWCDVGRFKGRDCDDVLGVIVIDRDRLQGCRG